jgi:hypothetical protein
MVFGLNLRTGSENKIDFGMLASRKNPACALCVRPDNRQSPYDAHNPQGRLPPEATTRLPERGLARQPSVRSVHVPSHGKEVRVVAPEFG